jgi:8-oxo-dGTP pyrophosphatase MutT (NUDIX family)
LKSFSETIIGLQKEVGGELPGMDAHLTMTPYRRLTKTIPDNYRESSVLLLLYEKEGVIYFPLILRKSYNGVHSNQMSFPGGKKELLDTNFYETALRETNEEIGVLKTNVSLLGELSSIYIPPSNFMVYPYVGFVKNPISFIKDSREVEAIFEIPLLDLLNENIIGETTVELSSKMQLKTPYFNLQNKVVWGATAAILAEFKVLLKNVFEN